MLFFYVFKQIKVILLILLLVLSALKCYNKYHIIKTDINEDNLTIRIKMQIQCISYNMWVYMSYLPENWNQAMSVVIISKLDNIQDKE